MSMTRTALRRHRYWIAALFTTWLSLALRAWGLDFQSLWRDEVDALRFATQPWPKLLAMFTRPGENGPLFYLLLRPWLAIAGHSEYALRFPSLMMGVLAIPLAMTLAARMRLSRSARISLGLLMATNPYLIWYSQEGKMYALVTTLVLASTLAFVEALRRGGAWRWALYWLLTTLCFYVHVLAVLVIPMHMLWFIAGWSSSRRRWRGYAAALAGLTLPYLPLVWWQLKLWNSSRFNPGFPFIPLDQMAIVLLLAFTRGMQPTFNAWGTTPAVFLALSGLWLKDDRMPHRGTLITWILLWLLFPPLALFAISLHVPLFTDRYLIWVAPALWILVAWGASLVARYCQWIAWLALGSILALHIQGVGFQVHTPIKSDFRQAAALVEGAREPGEIVMPIMPYIRYTYAYYAGNTTPLVDPPYTNAGATPEQVDAQMRRLLAGKAGVWLVISEENVWDKRHLVRAWLDEHGKAVLHARLARVEVIHYRLVSSP
ncbi:MAG: glycosyltransferase family 39 protein [Anaerolineae bacterium]|nr:glycosyltransferase family 39 protein [Anaerolineae bacterium]